MAHTEMPRPLLEDTIDRQHPVTPEKPVYLIQRHGIPGAHQKYLDLHLVPPLCGHSACVFRSFHSLTTPAPPPLRFSSLELTELN